MISRTAYITQLLKLVDKPFIKVITGIRRSGKSTLLKLLSAELLKRKVKAENIIYISFESIENADIDTARKLYGVVKKRMNNSRKYYVLLDEIQEVDGWEKAINAMFADLNVDIYITGSNSKLLSSELSTYIAGRYVEMQVLPLSFAEYLLFKNVPQTMPNCYAEFETFVRTGGFPAIHLADYDEDTAYKIIFDIYSSIILRDTVQRYNIRNLELLERIVRFVFDNIGNKFSAKSIADYFRSQQRKVDIQTVYNYLHALEGSFLIERVQRFDIQGKEILQTLEKYFIADQGLLYALFGYKDRFISGVLENIVFLELKRRGYKVYIGKLEQNEVDFVAERKNEKLYLQVSYNISDRKTQEREFQPLLKIKDNYPKLVITMDKFWKDNMEGIKHVHIADFLLAANLAAL